jgi:hypothetical protein
VTYTLIFGGMRYPYLVLVLVVLVEEPLAVTNILGSSTEKILVTAGGSSINDRRKDR